MKLILSAGSLYTLPPTLVFEMARDVGFDGMEVIINHDFAGSKHLEHLQELQSILPVLSIHAPFFEIDGWGNKSDQLKFFEFKFWRWLKKIKDFQSEIGQDGVLVTIENMPSLPQFKMNPYLLSKVESMVKFMEDRNLYLTFDTAHCGSMHTDFLGDFHQFYDSGRMRNIHFSDYGNGQEHLLPGHGALPLTRFLNHLRETSYDHALVVELAPYEFPKEPELIKETLAEIFDYLCKRPGIHSPDREEKTVRMG